MAHDRETTMVDDANIRLTIIVSKGLSIYMIENESSLLQLRTQQSEGKYVRV